MKVKCELEIDTDSGDYGVRLFNLSQPGEPIDYTALRPVLARVLDAWQADVEKGAHGDPSGGS